MYSFEALTLDNLPLSVQPFEQKKVLIFVGIVVVFLVIFWYFRKTDKAQNEKITAEMDSLKTENNNLKTKMTQIGLLK